MLRAYVLSQSSPRWETDPFLARSGNAGLRLARTLAAVFDYVTNVEYCSARLGRITDAKWIYCNAARDGEGGTARGTEARAFYSFLKQCPYCCLRVGLGARIEGAQHKPASHHIGEITGCLMTMLLAIIVQAAKAPLALGLVTKQSHSVDAVAFRTDLAVLLEIKASPLVTLPLASDLATRMTRDTDDGPAEYEQHRLIDLSHSGPSLYFFVPHREERMELGSATSPDWPYPQATTAVTSVDGFLDYLSAWAELYEAYAVPKTQRTGRIASVAYLTNGWGDEIDSNKTKPGLGRTDDLKKGTYQLLKYGAYYKDLCQRRALTTALLTNLDPVNLWAEYLERLLDVRWTKTRYVTELANHFEVPRERLYYLFEAIVAFNRPVVNDPVLRDVLDFDAAHAALVSGRLDVAIVDAWLA
jgi:hypothetical protein